MPFDHGHDLHLMQIQQACREAANALEHREAEIARLRDWLTNIKEIYECRADIFTNDADVAGSMYDRARAALEPKGWARNT